MAPLSPTQQAWRGRVEAVLRIVEPALNLLLAVGDRVSRAADRDGLDSPPPARRVESTTRTAGHTPAALPGSD